MMFGVLVLTAGVLVCGPGLVGVGAQRLRRSLEEECYNVGSCTPAEEPKGDEQEICRIFEESLACMQRATEACRQLDFPKETVHLASDGIHFLRKKLHNHCSERLGALKADARDGAGAGAVVDDGDGDDGGGRGGGGFGVGEEESSYMEQEMSARSEQNMADINSGNGLPSPASTVLVTSLLLAAMFDMWTIIL